MSVSNLDSFVATESSPAPVHQPQNNPSQRGRGRGSGRGRGRGRGSSVPQSPKPVEKQPKPAPQHSGRGSSKPKKNINIKSSQDSLHEEYEPSAKSLSKVEVVKSEEFETKIKPELSAQVHSALAADIIERLNSNNYECIICCQKIRRQVASWSCRKCFMIFHLYCAKKWYNSSDPNPGTKTTLPHSWRCPGCQFVYNERPAPKCFCGKVTDPQGNAFLVPHSCGEICGKKREGTDCPHSCTMVCHPGFCPPCPALGPLKSCYCGASSYRLRCGEKDKGKSCGEICGRKLGCGKHTCKQVCHAGPCAPCEITEEQICYCQKTKDKRFCGSGKRDHDGPGSFSCNNPCNQPLKCGNHFCVSPCHPGKCQDCQLLPENTKYCACGKVPISFLTQKPRTNCLDPVPLCLNICSKKLSCGNHFCQKKCHHGPCGECEGEVKLPCRCRSSNVGVSCKKIAGNSGSFEVLCNKMCKTPRSCGRHNCENRCCPSHPLADPYDMLGLHVCSNICGKMLRCGKHKCDLLCHAGKCPPCHVTSHEVWSCPCGQTKVDPPIICGTKMPECNAPCSKARDCGHPSNHSCHPLDRSCPPCTQMTEKMCSGGHELRKAPCNVKEICCGKLCNKMLACERHSCKRLCHSDVCLAVNANSPNSCNQICGRKQKHCNHSCPFPCHNGECPDVPCKGRIMIYCPCRRRSAEVECLIFSENFEENSKVTRELLCDEQCELESRNKKLSEAFGIKREGKTVIAAYSDSLIHMCKPNLAFVKKVESELSDFLRSKDQKYLFQPMPSLQRQIIHEMSKHYCMETESYDKEPNRCVLVAKKRDSKAPGVLLSSVVTTNLKSKELATAVINNAIELYNLSPEVKTQHLIVILAPFEGQYQLKWLDTSCLVIFKEYAQMKSAMAVLDGCYGGVIEMREYENPNAQKLEPKPIPSLPILKNSKAAQAPQTMANSGPVMELSNPFAVLDGAPVHNVAADNWEDLITESKKTEPVPTVVETQPSVDL